MKSGFLQLIHHTHTGRPRVHRHTSYAGLAFVLMITGVLLASISITADAATPAVNPQSGSIGLTGTVRGPAPSVAATITSPKSGSRTSSIPVTVTGACPQNTFVIITKNAAFAGATYCLDNGTYNLQVDLFDGQNTLLAKVSDALGQYGPDSNPVSIFYDSPSFTLASGSIGKQLFLQTNVTVTAVQPGSALQRTVTIVGGLSPYAVSWDWGDGATSLSSQGSEGSVQASHTYDRAGNYRVIVKVTDSTNNTAYIEMVTVVNGPVTAVSSASGKSGLESSLLVAWPVFILACIMVIFFWLGERRELAKLRHAAAAQNPVSA